MECASGDTFTHEASRGLSMESMFVPQPVMSLAVAPKKSQDASKFGKALKRFSREDPTFRMSTNEKTGAFVVAAAAAAVLLLRRRRLRLLLLLLLLLL